MKDGAADKQESHKIDGGADGGGPFTEGDKIAPHEHLIEEARGNKRKIVRTEGMVADWTARDVFTALFTFVKPASLKL